MKNFDANTCMDAFCALCEELVLNELVNIDECQYWMFEQGYRSADASLTEFSKLCDAADSSSLLSAIDCQYWLFERGHLAAKKTIMHIAEYEQIKQSQLVMPIQKPTEQMFNINVS